MYITFIVNRAAKKTLHCKWVIEWVSIGQAHSKKKKVILNFAFFLGWCCGHQNGKLNIFNIEVKKIEEEIKKNKENDWLWVHKFSKWPMYGTNWTMGDTGIRGAINN